MEPLLWHRGMASIYAPSKMSFSFPLVAKIGGTALVFYSFGHQLFVAVIYLEQKPVRLGVLPLHVGRKEHFTAPPLSCIIYGI